VAQAAAGQQRIIGRAERTRGSSISDTSSRFRAMPLTTLSPTPFRGGNHPLATSTAVSETLKTSLAK
jgi:hypothetical protein